MVVVIMIVITLLAGDLHAQVRAVESERAELINWFEINEFISTDSLRLATKMGNLYVYDEISKSWQPSEIMNGRKINRIEWSQDYEFYSPMHVLRNTSTGDTVNLSEVVPKNDGSVRAVFNGQHLALVGARNIVIYDISIHKVIMDVGGVRGFSQHSPNFMIDTLLYLLDGGYACVYNIYTGIRLKEYLAPSDMTIMAARQTSPRYKNIFIIPVMNSITAIDASADTLIDIYIKHIHDGRMRSFYLYKNDVYTSWYVDDSTTFIERTDLDTRRRELVCVIPSKSNGNSGTGSQSCIINYVDDEVIWVSDVYGGLYRYDRARSELEWGGDGIYEFTPKLVAEKEGKVMLSDTWLSFIIERDSVSMLARRTLSFVEQSFYRESLVMLNNYGVLYEIGYQGGDIYQIMGNTLSYYTKYDTVVYVSNINSVFMYDDSLKKLFDCQSCKIVDAGLYLFAMNTSGDLYRYEYANEEVTKLTMHLKHADKMAAVAQNGNVLILVNEDEIRGVDVNLDKELWRNPRFGAFVKKVTISNNEMIIMENGAILDPISGKVLKSMADGIVNTVNIQDSCFLFYKQGETIKIWFDGVSSLAQGRAETVRDLSIYPNPTAGSVTISAAKDIDELHVVIFNVVGRIVYKNDCETYAGRAVIDLEGLHPGMYIIQASDQNGVSYRKRFVKY
jgi:hypothetical protein